MSVKRKKTGLIISWQKSFSILPPWRKGKGDKDAVVNTEVVLTKMKLFSNFHERLLMADDSTSTTSTVSVSERVISSLDDKRQPRVECDSNYLSAVFPDSELQRLYKFESEDSGVELPSGANSPSTPTSSEQSFMVHSRESSCNSCNLNSDSTTLPVKLARYAQSSEIKKAADSMDNSLSRAVDTQDNVFIHSEELSPAVQLLHIGEDVDGEQCRASGISPEGDEEKCGQLEENSAVTERTCLEPGRQGTCDDMTGREPVRRRGTSDSLEEYMDQCCRLSELQHTSSSPRGSGLGYLEHICQLMEKISQLQETNLQLQRQICSLQKDGRVTKTRVDFFRQHCSCGTASLGFQEIQQRHSRDEVLSPSGTLSDLSTIHEVARHPLISTRTDLSSEGVIPIPLWKRGLNRRSNIEGEVSFLGGSTEKLSIPQRRLSENYTWDRVKDLVRKTKWRNQSRLGLTSTSLKMSCPQLYMSDLESEEPAGRNRNSMVALGHQSKLDLPWLE
ncbi:uncharacterized protein si:ch211-250c4.3 [Centropristis striata]|uniref:uncharacterized protein si:ch211-250c4.3 n=1 Tax=Centropristis striata TaxID=184440 RepID=UPI0027E0E820|nr:uncharacterized protein si:ch211-250c4.3 [Centropristis striata]